MYEAIQEKNVTRSSLMYTMISRIWRRLNAVRVEEIRTHMQKHLKHAHLGIVTKAFC